MHNDQQPDDGFAPTLVDERIEQLLQVPIPLQSSDASLVHDLRGLYQEDQLILARARARIFQDVLDENDTPLPVDSWHDPSTNNARVNYRGYRSTRQSSPRPKRASTRRFALLAAAILAIVLVGSMASFAYFTHQDSHQTTTALRPTPTLTHLKITRRSVSIPSSNGPTSNEPTITVPTSTATTSNAPIGKTIWFKSTAVNLYVSARFILPNSPLHAEALAVSTWESFLVVDAGNGTIALRDTVYGNYVTASSSETNTPLEARSTQIQTAETFRWIDLGNGTIALQAVINGKYVTASSSETNNPLEARSNQIQSQETFQWGLAG